MVMSIPQWALLAFALWTITVPLGAVAVYRWNLIVRRVRGIHTFHADVIDGADWYRRAMRAHANCLENLPVFGAIVVLAALIGFHSALFDAMAIAVVFARIGQTVTHMCFRASQRAATIRFAFFAIQHICMVAMGVVIACCAASR